MLAQPLAALDTSGNTAGDAPLSQATEATQIVIAFVGVQFFFAPVCSTQQTCNGRNRLPELLKYFALSY